MHPPHIAVAPRSLEELADSEDLRTVISQLLARAPLNERALRCAVWSFVGLERRAGVPPAAVIARLTDLIVLSTTIPFAGRAPLTRRVILWCVEEYFGHLGGDALSADMAGPLPIAPSSPEV